MYFQLFRYTGLILIAVSLLGMYSARRRTPAALFVYGGVSLTLVAVSLAAIVFYLRALFSANHFILATLTVFSWLVFLTTSINAFCLGRLLRHSPLELHDIFEMDDIEAFTEGADDDGIAEEASKPEAAQYEEADTPQGTPIYIAAPAYYPQLSESAVPYPYAPNMPQFIPLYVDANGQPFAVPAQ